VRREQRKKHVRLCSQTRDPRYLDNLSCGPATKVPYRILYSFIIQGATASFHWS
jgi:hypothetical protein